MECFSLEEKATHQSRISDGERAKLHGSSHLGSCMLKGEVPGLSRPKTERGVRSTQVYKIQSQRKPRPQGEGGSSLYEKAESQVHRSKGAGLGKFCS